MLLKLFTISQRLYGGKVAPKSDVCVWINAAPKHLRQLRVLSGGSLFVGLALFAYAEHFYSIGVQYKHSRSSESQELDQYFDKSIIDRRPLLERPFTTSKVESAFGHGANSRKWKKIIVALPILLTGAAIIGFGFVGVVRSVKSLTILRGGQEVLVETFTFPPSKNRSRKITAPLRSLQFQYNDILSEIPKKGAALKIGDLPRYFYMDARGTLMDGVSFRRIVERRSKLRR